MAGPYIFLSRISVDVLYVVSSKWIDNRILSKTNISVLSDSKGAYIKGHAGELINEFVVKTQRNEDHSFPRRAVVPGRGRPTR